MNFAKAQKEVVNELLKGSRSMGRFSIDERNIFVSPDGYRGYIFPTSTIAFNLEKIKEIPVFPIAEIVKEDNELKLTPDLRIIDHYRVGMVRRLKGKGKNVYVNVKYLDFFQNPHFYQDESSIGLIVVTETAFASSRSATRIEEPVGIIMPVRASWDDGTYYGDTGRV